jgi:hypothetical protein
MAGVGGMLCLMRVLSDAYSSVPASLVNIVLIGLTWVLALLTFAAMVLCLRNLNRLVNLGAVLVVVSVLELVFFGCMTQIIFTVPLRSHEIEEAREISRMVAGINKDAYQHNAPLVLEGATFKRQILVIQYKYLESGGFSLDELRSNLMRQACGYFANYSRYGTLTGVTYVFSLNEGRDFFSFKTKDCMDAPEIDVQDDRGEKKRNLGRNASVHASSTKAGVKDAR